MAVVQDAVYGASSGPSRLRGIISEFDLGTYFTASSLNMLVAVALYSKPLGNLGYGFIPILVTRTSLSPQGCAETAGRGARFHTWRVRGT